MNLTQAERELYLDRCRRQLVNELEKQTKVDCKDRDRFEVFKIFDSYCPFTDERAQLWKEMKRQRDHSFIQCLEPHNFVSKSIKSKLA